MKYLTPENFRHEITGRIGKAQYTATTKQLFLTGADGKLYRVELTPDLVLDTNQAAETNIMADWIGLEVTIYLEAGKMRLRGPDKKQVETATDFISPEQYARTLANEPIDRWAAWLVLILQNLEMDAADIDPDHPENFELELERLKDAITDRLDKKHW